MAHYILSFDNYLHVRKIWNPFRLDQKKVVESMGYEYVNSIFSIDWNKADGRFKTYVNLIGVMIIGNIMISERIYYDAWEIGLDELCNVFGCKKLNANLIMKI